MENKIGWEYDYLEDSIELQDTLDKDPDKLLEYSRQNPLCAVHSDKRKLAIVRQYHFVMEDDLITLYSGEPHGDGGHWGIELIDLEREVVHALSEPLPENLTYQRVEFQGDSILIVAKEKQFLTNWSEMERKFPFLTNFNEQQITEIYDSLINDDVVQEVAKRQKPKKKTIKTDFSTLTLDKEYQMNFQGRGKWTDKKIELNFAVDQNGEIELGINTARILLNKQAEWDEKIKSYTAKKLLKLKNESWLDEDEKKLTSLQFKERMTVESIIFYEDGAFEFFFDDGNLFWGHSIQVSGSIQEGLTQALFQG